MTINSPVPPTPTTDTAQTTPTAAPPAQAAPQTQAAAPSVAPAQNNAPAQTPASKGVTPTPASATPGNPVQATATIADAHPTSVLRGILMGALGAAAKIGKGIEKVGEATGAGQDIRRSMDAHNAAITANKGAIAQQTQQAQAAKDAQQKAADEHVAAGDIHNEMPLRMNYVTAQAAGQVIINQQNQENLNQTQRNNMKLNNEDDAQFLEMLDRQGIKTNADHGPGFDNLGPNHVKDFVSANTVGVSNGKLGKDAGLVIVDTSLFDKTPLNVNETLTEGYDVDPKTGALTARKKTLHAGENTVGDWAKAYYGAKGEFNEKSKLANQIAAQNANAADIKLKAQQGENQEAQAREKNREAQILAQGGVVVPPDYKAPANAFTMTPQEIETNLRAQKINVPANFQALYGAAHYKLDPNTFPSRPYNRPGTPPQMGKDQAFSYIRTFINPNYDENNYKAVQGMEKEFASTRNGTAGGNLIAFNTATGHLGQLYDAASALQNGNIQLLNQMANSLGTAVGQPAPTVYNGIKTALVGELGKTFKGAAPDVPEMDEIDKTLNNTQSPQQMISLSKTYAHLMLTKAAAQAAHYYSYTGELPPQVIDPRSASVYQRMGINTQDALPAGASIPTGAIGRNTSNANTMSVNGTPYPMNPDGTVTINGHSYKPSADGKSGTLVSHELKK